MTAALYEQVIGRGPMNWNQRIAFDGVGTEWDGRTWPQVRVLSYNDAGAHLLAYLHYSLGPVPREADISDGERLEIIEYHSKAYSCLMFAAGVNTHEEEILEVDLVLLRSTFAVHADEAEAAHSHRLLLLRLERFLARI